MKTSTVPSADLERLRRIQAEHHAAQAKNSTGIEGITSAFDEVITAATSGAESKTVTERLKRKFGLGQQPAKRLKLYAQIEAVVKLHGEAAMTVVSECVAEAVNGRAPDRLFCFVVKRRLIERGFLSEGGGDASW
jgi:hypothetical protein